MQTVNLIAIKELCARHDIEITFIHSLRDYGLIEITMVEESAFIASDQLQRLEKFIHLYYELDINLEGIETITHLLERISALQDEIVALKNRLRLYESFNA